MGLTPLAEVTLLADLGVDEAPEAPAENWPERQVRVGGKDPVYRFVHAAVAAGHENVALGRRGGDEQDGEGAHVATVARFGSNCTRGGLGPTVVRRIPA